MASPLCRVLLVSCLTMVVVHDNSVSCFTTTQQHRVLEKRMSRDAGKSQESNDTNWCYFAVDRGFWSASCSNRCGQRLYIPRLPDYIVELCFMANCLTSEMLDGAFFENATNIKTLDLTYNNLTYIPDGAFNPIKHLTVLDLSYNSDLSLKGIVYSLSSLPTLRQLGAAFAGIRIIPSDLFRGKNILIDVLDLGGNDIDEISLTTFGELRQLRQLHLDSNRIRRIHPDRPTRTNILIEILDLSRNFLEEINLTTFGELRHLKELYLEINHIRRIEHDLPLAVTILDLSLNKLSTFPVTCRNGTSLFPNLTHFFISKNNIDAVPESVCLPQVGTFKFSFNSLDVVQPRAFSDEKFPMLSSLTMYTVYNVRSTLPLVLREHCFHNKHLHFLDLSINLLSFSNDSIVAADAFAGCSNLSELVLFGNFFQEVSDERLHALLGHLPLTYLSLSACQLSEISRTTFAPFSRLTTLILSRNGISTIPDGAFDSLSNLKELDISMNKLSSLPDGVFDNLSNLKDLDISNNAISVITRDSFGEKMRRQLHSLYLDQNLFTCSCDLLWFQSWLVSDRSLFYDKDCNCSHYMCHNIPGTAVENVTLNQQACLLSEATNIQIIWTCSIVILALTAFSFAFRYRWHVRLLLYEAFRGRGDVRRRRLQANNFDYDVFVSYDSEDLLWVRQHLMPELEDRLGLRLCDHERDFVPGKTILENIADCVESSKKILMVFSKDFVVSQWCQFELTYCLRHVMDHDDDLIIVCVDDVASREMTTAMMAVLKTTTYIQWAELDDAMASFWGRLRVALNEAIDQV